MTNKTTILNVKNHLLTTSKWSSIQYWQLGECLAKQHFNKKTLTVLASRLNKRSSKKWSVSQFKKLIQFQSIFSIDELNPKLSWSHYQLLISIEDDKKRRYYYKESILNTWTCKQLRRQIKTAYYERLLSAHPLGIKQLYIIEFAKPCIVNPSDKERQLEQALMNNIQALLLEFGSNFSFVARQKLIKMPSGQSFFIDLILYHTQEHQTILIELKINELSHRDIGQLDTYVRLYDKYYRPNNDKPTIGLLLVPELNQDLLVYSSLLDNSQLFAAKYALTPLPS